MSHIDDNQSPFNSIHQEIIDEYLEDHSWPWVIGFSGGKDSTLVVHLVYEILLSLPPSQRKRQVHIVANDTLVESPLVVQHIIQRLDEIDKSAKLFDLPIKTKITNPEESQTFWVNIIGRGYPLPNQNFRWCTDRMKIRPTSRYIESLSNDAGKAILLLGVRRSESISRGVSVSRYDNGNRLHNHPNLKGCMVFRPIIELSSDDVWEYLALNDPPWGSTHQQLILLYRNASGGECPVITSKDETPSCGTSSSRFGCWTCSVVAKDRSLEGFVESGFYEFSPLLDFRDWLISIRNDKTRRLARRRDGRITITNSGKLIPGPFTLETRVEILERLHLLEKKTGKSLISAKEVEIIHSIWSMEIKNNSKPSSLTIREMQR